MNKGVPKQVLEETLRFIPRKQNPDWFNENKEIIVGALSTKELCRGRALGRPNDKKDATGYRKAKGGVQRITRQLESNRNPRTS